MKPIRTWILVADGGRARILETIGKGQGVHVVSGSDEAIDNPPSHLQGRDKPARVYESVGHARHAAEPRPESRQDPHRALETLFANQLATMLSDHVASQSFDHLVLVAPPKMLGDLRKLVVPSLREKIVAEIDKDLTKIPYGEILSHLDDVITL